MTTSADVPGSEYPRVSQSPCNIFSLFCPGLAPAPRCRFMMIPRFNKAPFILLSNPGP